jgi:hypothetical protein
VLTMTSEPPPKKTLLEVQQLVVDPHGASGVPIVHTDGRFWSQVGGLGTRFYAAGRHRSPSTHTL